MALVQYLTSDDHYDTMVVEANVLLHKRKKRQAPL